MRLKGSHTLMGLQYSPTPSKVSMDTWMAKYGSIYQFVMLKPQQTYRYTYMLNSQVMWLHIIKKHQICELIKLIKSTIHYIKAFYMTFADWTANDVKGSRGKADTRAREIAIKLPGNLLHQLTVLQHAPGQTASSCDQWSKCTCSIAIQVVITGGVMLIELKESQLDGYILFV